MLGAEPAPLRNHRDRPLPGPANPKRPGRTASDSLRGELDVQESFRRPARASDAARGRRRACPGPDHGRNPAEARAHRETSGHARHRRDHRRGHLRADRPGGGDARRSGRRAELRLRRHRLCVRGPVLRRVCLDAAGVRQCIFVFVRDARRDRRVVHRLDADPRISLRRIHGRGRLVRLLQQPAALDRRAPEHAACLACGPGVRAADRDRRSDQYDRFAHQLTRRADHRRDQLALLCRHHAVGFGQRGDRRDQAGRDPAVRCVQPAIRQSGELASVRAADRRGRPLRLERRVPWRIDRVLLVHRLRRGIDRRAGSEESATRYADRYSRLAGRLHRALYRGLGRAHRVDAVHAARHAASGRHRDRRRFRACAGCGSSSRSVRLRACHR